MTAEIFNRDSREVTIEEALGEHYKTYDHAVHCFIWSPWDSLVFGRHQTVAAVLMQLRFDGSLGFHGGLVDTKPQFRDEIVAALNKELEEELNLKSKEFHVTVNQHLFSRKDDEHKLICHFYALRVSLEDIRTIEVNSFSARDYGEEVFGLIRVPLYTMEDGFKGFPVFLNNMFIADAKDQLCKALKCLELLSENAIRSALQASERLKDR